MLLNGWKRLWVVISIILLFVFGYYAFNNKIQKPKFVEDVSILQELNSDSIIKKEIKGLGIVEFPVDIDQKEIDKIVKSNLDNSTIEQIPIIAKKLKQESNENAAKRAHDKNKIIRSENQKVIFYAFFGWLCTIFVLYAIGWSIGWIYKGFKN